MKKEWIIPSLFLLLIIIPYLIAYATTPEGFQFTGFLSHIVDNMTYLSKINNNENFVFMNYYNSIEQKGGFVFWVYSLIGETARLLHIPSMVSFHFFRILFSIFFILSLHSLFKQLKLSKKVYYWAMIFVLFGNQEESIFFFLNKLFYDPNYNMFTYINESTLFLSAFYFPHFILALTLLVLAWKYAFTYHETKTTSKLILSGITLLILSTIHPYTTVICGIAIGIFLTLMLYREKQLNWRKFYPILYLGLIPLPYLLWSVILFKTNVVILTWMNAAVMVSVFNPVTLFVFGLHGLLFFYFSLQKRFWENHITAGLLIWIWVSFIASALPFHSGVRFIEGILVPFFILFAIWFTTFIKKHVIWGIVLMTYMLMTTVLLTTEPAWNINPANSFWYVSNDLKESYDWLKQHKNEHTIVLSDPDASLEIPAYSETLTFYGHIHEAQGNENKNKMFNSLVQDPIKQWNSGWIQRNEITHILINKNKIQLSQDLDTLIPVHKVFQNKTVTIYEVDK